MAKSIIDEIKAAEKEAHEIVQSAKDKAQKTLETAKAQALKKQESIKAEAQKKAQAVVATSENNAYKVKSREFEENSKQANDLKDNASKNLPKAVDLIIKEIIPD